jgi:hypothetical protein
MGLGSFVSTSLTIAAFYDSMQFRNNGFALIPAKVMQTKVEVLFD